MNPEEMTLSMDLDGNVIIPRNDVEVEVVRSQGEQAPEAPAVPKSYWEENGFLDEIAKVCVNLEGEREQFLFPAEIRQIIETINNAQSVTDFDRYNDAELQEFINTLRRRVPQVEREVVTFINQLTRARSVAVDTVDFI
jgi:hypothetical protein